MKVVVTANTSFNLVNFRAGLIEALARDGHEVVALAPRDAHSDAFGTDLDCSFAELRLEQRGTSPPREAISFLAMVSALRRLRPDVVLSYTIKNNLYGGVAARLLRIPIIPNVTGMGLVFSGRGGLEEVARRMYRHAFASAPVVFFQNAEDQAHFGRIGAVPADRTRLLPGSGVDLARFPLQDLPDRPGAPVFLFVGRLLREKGVAEFVEAARRVRDDFPGARFRIAGGLEPAGDDAVPADAIAEWAGSGLIEHLGRVDDVRPVLAEATCVVLPSYYREGTPRALLEAGASGRPIVTTDMPGCRTVVEDGVTGHLVPPRDVAALAAAMRAVAGAEPGALRAMGRAGRAHVEAHFDEEFVIRAYRDAIAAIEDGGR